jgi:GNAT superfamily N-acetyltransferase
MGTRIEIGDPVQYAYVASQILRSAWKPPCLHYSTDYLAWQFSFPSDIPRRAAIAFLDDRPVGCISVTTRRLACAQDKLSAYVLSFVAVDPSASRRGLAAAMYASLLDALPVDIPVIAFAEPASIGERLLLDSFERAGFRHHPLQACRAVGYLNRPNASAKQDAVVRSTARYQEFALEARLPQQQDVIWTEIDEDHWHHYRQDPRERTMLTVHDSRGNPLGTAMHVSAEIMSSQGLQRVPMLDSVALTEPTSDALAALFGFAASRSQPGSTVIASNLSFVDSTLFKAAGARALPSSFDAHVFVAGQKNIVETAAALNLEVI